jgi:hypothetical protein
VNVIQRISGTKIIAISVRHRFLNMGKMGGNVGNANLFIKN